jgi:ParB family chromosome partitioning protein
VVKRGLGRGLGALLPAEEEENIIKELRLEAIISNEYQPREGFAEDKLDELAASIQEHGIIQPIVVQPYGEGKFRIVAGERRWRACKKAGLEKIPAIIRDLSGRERAELALVENLQRENLNPLEEARACARLIEEFGLTQEEVARRLGKSRPVISNTLRLLQLPEEVQQLLREEIISVGHARALLGIIDEQELKELTKRVVTDKLTVRETEKLVRDRTKRSSKQEKVPNEKINSFIDHELDDVLSRLQDKLGTRVTIKPGKSGGRIEIFYYDTRTLSS